MNSINDKFLVMIGLAYLCYRYALSEIGGEVTLVHIGY